MPIRVEQPGYLWLLAAMVPMGLLALAWFVSMSRARAWTAIVFRAGLLGLLALALAGVSRVQTTRKLAVVAVVDVSESVRRWGSAASLDDAASRGAVLDRVRRFVADGTKDRGAEDLLGIVAFDGKAVALAAPTLGDAASASFDVRVSGGTNIAAAIELARALVPSDAAGEDPALFRRGRDGGRRAGGGAGGAGRGDRRGPDRVRREGRGDRGVGWTRRRTRRRNRR
jgi:hypothetical protein